MGCFQGSDCQEKYIRVLSYCGDLTTWQGIRTVAPAIAGKWPTLFDKTISVISMSPGLVPNFHVLGPDDPFRADSKFAPSQWEMALLCNDVSHWLGANLESALPFYGDVWCQMAWGPLLCFGHQWCGGQLYDVVISSHNSTLGMACQSGWAWDYWENPC